jgi:16S rRNA (cytidine1402-2'-O)-methyltransferase
MPGILYVVATPIGNLEDVTLRALRILREVSVIAAEDTRRTARLLQHYSISTRTTSLHEHNEHAKTSTLIARLQAGESVALVSDAGTPVVSDPGAMLVAAAHAGGVRVEPIPGPSAVVAALSACGFPETQFTFIGFPPVRSKARKQLFAGLAAETRTLVFYEAPHRIRATLADMFEVFGDRELLLGREITKAHETLVIRPISIQLSDFAVERGEYTLVLRGAEDKGTGRPEIDVRAVAAEFGDMTNNAGVSRREALRTLAARYGLSNRELYALLEQQKRSVD